MSMIKIFWVLGMRLVLLAVAHTDKAPHIGFESYYSVNNIMGNFINFSTGYANTYLHQELFLSLQRDFFAATIGLCRWVHYYAKFQDRSGIFE